MKDAGNWDMADGPLVHGIVLGRIIGSVPDGLLVTFSDDLQDKDAVARSLIPPDLCPIGALVALSFENGNPTRPIILGRMRNDPDRPASKTEAEPGSTLDLSAEREVTIRCGKASITLTREGKIILRGTYISSRSSGMNRIKGGSVHLN